MAWACCPFASTGAFEYLCSVFTASLIGLGIGMVIGLILCHFGLIRINKRNHR